MRYLYAMTIESFYSGNYPDEGFVGVKFNSDWKDCSFSDLLIYDRKLEEDEVGGYGLRYIGAFKVEF